ncbi:MAG: hypothetical protein HY923_10070 [Elusimicrobia bacterium]|nr:hypothetical protein [Elusimicrobiota bacterium]
MDRPARRAAVIGSLSAVVVFTLLELAQAFGGRGLNIATLSADPARYYGKEITVSGVARSIYNGYRYVDAEKIPTVSLTLYEIVNGKPGRLHISATAPASQFRTPPKDDEIYSVTGRFAPPADVGSIGEQP